MSSASSDASDDRFAGHEWTKKSLEQMDILWVVLDGSRVLGLRCRGKEKLQPWRMAKQTFLSLLGQNAMDEVETDKALKKQLQAVRESFGSGCLNPVRVRGLQAFGVANNKLGYERAAYLALALTAMLGGWRAKGKELRKLKSQVEMAMLASMPVSASSSKSEVPFHASSHIQPAARPSTPIPVKAMPPIAAALASASSKAPPMAPPNGTATAKVQSETKEEIKDELEVKIEPIDSSEDEFGGEDQQL